MKTNLDGVVLGAVDTNKAYKLEIEPVRDVDITVAGTYVAIHNYQVVDVVLVAMQPGEGMVTYGDQEYASVPATQVPLTQLAPSLYQGIDAYQSQQEADYDTDIGLVAVQLFKDVNANGTFDPKETPVPWAGVEVRLR